MRISDWSSDVCSSDLGVPTRAADGPGVAEAVAGPRFPRHPRAAAAVEGIGALAGARVGFEHRAHDPRGAGRHDAPVDARVAGRVTDVPGDAVRSEEHTSELQSLMRLSYSVFCLKT